MTAVHDITGIIPLRLDAEAEELLQSESFQKNGRSARFLLEQGELRVLMVALAPGASMPEHKVDGPALVQAIRGDLVLRAADAAWELGPGSPRSVSGIARLCDYGSRCDVSQPCGCGVARPKTRHQPADQCADADLPLCGAVAATVQRTTARPTAAA